MKVIVLILLAALILALDVKALAVASDYLKDSTLELIEETSTIYSIRLQNPGSEELKVKVDYDKTFMKPIDFKEEYTLPPESSTGIQFNITAPKYHKDNDVFTVGYTVHQLTGPAGGGIPFLTKINKNFKLKVVKDPNKWHINYFHVVYIVILLIIIFFLYRQKKPK